MRGRTDLIMSAANLVEALIVGRSRGFGDDIAQLVDVAGIHVMEVTKASAIEAAAAHRRWGRGQHPAKLNFGDCFAYELASRHNCPLLFVGDDFSQTDIESAL